MGRLVDGVVLALFCLQVAPLFCVVLCVAYHRQRVRLRRGERNRRLPRLRHAAVVSLSPASHSPRALNHVRALVRCGEFAAALHAQGACPDLALGDAACFIPVPSLSPAKAYSSFMRKTVAQAWDLYCSLVCDDAAVRYDVILVNTPPCIPVFAVVLFAARVVHSCPVIIDWHNFAYSIMRVGGASQVLVRAAKTLEWALGRQMDGHVCVSNAMARFLAEEWGIEARVLYDRPPEEMRRVKDKRESHDLFQVLHDCANIPVVMRGDVVETIATRRERDGSYSLRADRPALIVSSTSWTPDEDFDLLLEALLSLDRILASKERERLELDEIVPGHSRRVVCVITGRGPLRAAFEQKYRESKMSFVRIWFAWLPQEYYPKLLGCADLGVSMHTSSSGLDLPMKVVDMLGCGLPALAYEYRCIDELVREGETGMLFGRSSELAERIVFLLCDVDGRRRHAKMVEHICEQFSSPRMRWQSSWERDALPLLRTVCSGR